MLKSCKHCGRIHDKKHKCKQSIKPKSRTEIDKFRSTSDWQNKRDEIKERDNYLCQICVRKLYNTLNQYNYNDLSVHHAIPMAEDYDKRLDNDNLLTVCDRHHEAAEAGLIPRDVILAIIREQEHPPEGAEKK